MLCYLAAQMSIQEMSQWKGFLQFNNTLLSPLKQCELHLELQDEKLHQATFSSFKSVEKKVFMSAHTGRHWCWCRCICGAYQPTSISVEFLARWCRLKNNYSVMLNWKQDEWLSLWIDRQNPWTALSHHPDTLVYRIQINATVVYFSSSNRARPPSDGKGSYVIVVTGENTESIRADYSWRRRSPIQSLLLWPLKSVSRIVLASEESTVSRGPRDASGGLEVQMYCLNCF